jgi:hypothetical protein
MNNILSNKKLTLPSQKSKDEIKKDFVDKVQNLALDKWGNDSVYYHKAKAQILIPIEFIFDYNNAINNIHNEVNKQNEPKYDYNFWCKVSNINHLDNLTWIIDDGGDSGEKYGYLSIASDDWETRNFDFDEFDAIEEAWNVIQTIPNLKIKIGK